MSILELVRHHYVEEVDEHALLQSAMKGLLQDLDPHSSFMEPTEFDEMQVETKGEFHGLGIEISKATAPFATLGARSRTSASGAAAGRRLRPRWPRSRRGGHTRP